MIRPGKPLIGVLSSTHSNDYFRLVNPSNDPETLLSLRITDEQRYDDPYLSLYGPEGYIETIKYTSQRLLAIIQAILDKSAVRPIIIVQGDHGPNFANPGGRTKPEDMNQFYVKNNDGDMVPLGSVTSTKKIFGPEYTNRFNLFRAAWVTGNAAPGYSSGDAMSSARSSGGRLETISRSVTAQSRRDK